MATAILAADTDSDSAPRDLVWEGLVELCGTAKMCGEYSAYLVLEHVIKARENGTIGGLAMHLETHWIPSSPGDHPAVERDLTERLAGLTC